MFRKVGAFKCAACSRVLEIGEHFSKTQQRRQACGYRRCKYCIQHKCSSEREFRETKQRLKIAQPRNSIETQKREIAQPRNSVVAVVCVLGRAFYCAVVRAIAFVVICIICCAIILPSVRAYFLAVACTAVKFVRDLIRGAVACTAIFAVAVTYNIARPVNSSGDLEQTPVTASVIRRLVFGVPSYFRDGDAPKICDDYRPDGVNCKSAELMLHEEKCDICPWCPELEVISFRRIENREVFERFMLHQDRARENLATLSPTEREQNCALVPEAHPWIERFEQKNALPRESNTRYLLHGTKSASIVGICSDGLVTSKARTNGGSGVLSYGRGCYFTRASCKACQYTDTSLPPRSSVKSTVIICRVVLGRIEELKTRCPTRDSALDGHDSAMAVGGKTRINASALQVHDEFIVYEDAGCYPEFIIEFKARAAA